MYLLFVSYSVIPASFSPLTFISFLLVHLFHSLILPLSFLNPKFTFFLLLTFFQKFLLWLLLLQPLESSLNSWQMLLA